MNPIDVVSNWLSSVAYSHSQSKATEEQYKRVWDRFSTFIGRTASQILTEYESSDDRTFRRKYAQEIRFWIADLTRAGLTTTSIKVMVGAIKSFFKYNDLPLGMVPQAREGTTYHNRDITKEEIVQIMAMLKPREKAFFAVMAQSGLRPHTIKQLRLRHIELERVPSMITVPKELAKGKFGSYVTFIGQEGLKYVKQYLATRTNLTPESLLFSTHEDPAKPVNVKDMSRAFRLSARKLEKTGALSYEVRTNKPSELRLYTLRKFFRKYAGQMGPDYVNYLMGHTVRGSDENYKPQDPEFYRQLYEEKAMPFLRLDTATPTETDNQIQELRTQLTALTSKLSEKDREIQELKQLLQPLAEIVKLLNDRNQVKLVVHEPTPEELEVQKQEIKEFEEREAKRAVTKKPQE